MKFLFPTRISRLSYFLRNLSVVAVAYGLSAIAEEPLQNKSPLWLLLLISILAFALLAYWVFYIGRPRCKDAGINRWFLLLALVPYVDAVFGLTLLFTRTRLEPENGQGHPI